jgi:hypothetical protein
MTVGAAAERPVSGRWSNWIIGFTVYPAGDLLAQLITGSVSFPRLAVLALVGGLLYRFEVPWWFRKLDQIDFSEEVTARRRWLRFFVRDPERDRHLNWLGRTAGAILYFNPIWIARHMFFIRLGSDPASLVPFAPVAATLCLLGLKSFLVNLPISFAGNYIIQMRLPLRWRFLGSSIFSGLLAAAYALAYRYL